MSRLAVEAAGLPLAAEERGSGETVVLVHAAGMDRRMWAPTFTALGNGIRAVTYDRRGYGESAAPEPYSGTTIEEQAEDLAAVASAAGPPVLLAGQGTGALVALDLMRRRPGLATGAVLADPPLLALSATGPAHIGALRAEIAAAAAAGEDVRLPGIDLAAEANWEFTRGALRAIEVPAIVLRGEGAPPAPAEAADALAALLPRGRLSVAPGPGPAPEAIAAAVREMLRAP